ncbi:unnamed protein product [Linum tenue]|uniref:Agglutinin domain-containing protein n=1 Tax=Linum tenue TaxID=586396 RepID=A0AAV0KJG9_9ROSI|nr:unnamed protein product [Linum tenue]
MGTTVAGLPRFVVLRSRRANRYLHYLWNDQWGLDYYQFIGMKRDLDPVSPFVKLEVVPSTTNPSSYVHLRCSYNNKFFRVVLRFGVWWVTATADNPNEDTSRVGECTLFEHVFVGNQINTVWFRYVPNQRRLTWFNNPAHPYLYRLSLVYSANPLYGDFYEFAPWESYEDRMRAKHYQIQTRDMEIQRLTAQVAARDEELRNLRRQLAHKDEVILDLKGRVAALKAYLEKRKAKLEYGMLTLHSTVTSAWESFQLNVACGIVRIAAGFEQILTLPAT